MFSSLKTSPCFNSSMVRLGEISEGGIASYNTRFQFQYGSIGSDCLIANAAGTTMFQFQYGSIGRKNQLSYHMLLLCVSIPVWFDWEPNPSH